MQRIHDFKIDLASYYARGKDNLFPDWYDCPNPKCKYTGRLWRIGFYERNAISATAVYRIVIRRYRCPACHRTYSLLPSFLAPHIQYTLAVVFHCLRLIALMQMPFRAAASLTSEAMTYQQVSLYKGRVENKHGLCQAVLVESGQAGDTNESFLQGWVKAVEREGGIELFSHKFIAAWKVCFLAKIPSGYPPVLASIG